MWNIQRSLIILELLVFMTPYSLGIASFNRITYSPHFLKYVKTVEELKSW